MRQAHRRRALIALALVAATAGWGLWRALLPSRTLVLPADAALLLDLAGRARDAGDLRARLRSLGIHSVRVDGRCEPAPAWTPQASDAWLDLWRRCTRPVGRADRAVPLQRRPGRARVLGLDEPPGLAELGHPGDALMAQGRVREARAAWARALRRAPALPGLLARLAEADRRLGDFRSAERSLARALHHAGMSPDLYARLGRLYLSMKRFDLAGTALEQAAGLDGTSASRWLEAARVLDSAGERSRAADCARRALNLEPGSTDAKALAVRLGAGAR